MSDTDDTERELRVELMRLEHRLKLRDLHRKDQQLAYGPVKLLLLALGVTGALIAVWLFLLRLV